MALPLKVSVDTSAGGQLCAYAVAGKASDVSAKASARMSYFTFFPFCRAEHPIDVRPSQR